VERDAANPEEDGDRVVHPEGWGLAGDILLLVSLCELQGTIALQVRHDRHSARLRLVDQSRLMPGSQQAVSAQCQACTSTLCLPVGQGISLNMLQPLPGWSWLLSRHLQTGAELVWGWLAPAVYSWPLFYYIIFPLSLSFLSARTKAVSGSLSINGISRSTARNNKNNHPIHSFGQSTANRLCV